MRSADQIAVIDNGVVVEVGTHEQLIAKQGAYFRSVMIARDKSSGFTSFFYFTTGVIRTLLESS